jgi:uracil phosphoribosyltransferase
VKWAWLGDESTLRYQEHPLPVSSSHFHTLRVFEHPLIRHKLTIARDRSTPPADFRRLLNEIAGLMTYEVSRRFETRATPVQTPLEITEGHALSRPITLVPILRAGLSMTDGVLALFPEARVGHIGIRRDEATHRPVTYYARLPNDVALGYSIVIDPMLATGGSACAAIRYLKEAGCKDIQMICLVAAPEGVKRVHAEHPDVMLYACALDRELDSNAYIRPGLGDAGDRVFGTQGA